MSLSDLASLGSFVSGAAVLISLIYVGYQIRQASKHQRALMNQGYFARVQENLHWLAAPVNNQLRARINAGETTFTEEELYLLNVVLRTTLLNVQDVYQQHQSGLLDTEVFESSTLG